MAGYFTRIEVRDPHLLPQLAWEKLPPSEKALLTQAEFSFQQWAPLDKRRFRIEPESYRTESLMANVGAVRFSRNSHTRAKETKVLPPGLDGFAISMIERGAGQLVLPGSHEPVISNATTGLIYSGEPGTRLTASDLHSRLLFGCRLRSSAGSSRRCWMGRESDLLCSSQCSIRRAAPAQRSAAWPTSCSPSWNT